jgi:hypothetical protein
MGSTGNKLKRLFTAQNGCCFYCQRQTYLAGWRAFKALHPGMSTRGARYRQATIEHLLRRADGGTNRNSNVVMACLECNSHRGALPWTVWLQQRRPLVDPTPGIDVSFDLDPTRPEMPVGRVRSVVPVRRSLVPEGERYE